MKKLNITKEHFEKSRYFTRKYGTLEYVSESGKVYKTSKGNLIKFNEDRLDYLWERVDELKDRAERTLDNEFQGWRDLASFDFDLVDSNTEPGIDVYVYFTRDKSIPIPCDGFAEPEDVQRDLAYGIIATKHDIL